MPRIKYPRHFNFLLKTKNRPEIRSGFFIRKFFGIYFLAAMIVSATFCGTIS